jgi:hypothetical protein
MDGAKACSLEENNVVSKMGSISCEKHRIAFLQLPYINTDLLWNTAFLDVTWIAVHMVLCRRDCELLPWWGGCGVAVLNDIYGISGLCVWPGHRPISFESQ